MAILEIFYDPNCRKPCCIGKKLKQSMLGNAKPFELRISEVENIHIACDQTQHNIIIQSKSNMLVKAHKQTLRYNMPLLIGKSQITLSKTDSILNYTVVTGTSKMENILYGVNATDTVSIIRGDINPTGNFFRIYEVANNDPLECVLHLNDQIYVSECKPCNEVYTLATSIKVIHGEVVIKLGNMNKYARITKDNEQNQIEIIQMCQSNVTAILVTSKYPEKKKEEAKIECKISKENASTSKNIEENKIDPPLSNADFLDIVKQEVKKEQKSNVEDLIIEKSIRIARYKANITDYNKLVDTVREALRRMQSCKDNIRNNDKMSEYFNDIYPWNPDQELLHEFEQIFYITYFTFAVLNIDISLSQLKTELG